MPRAALLTTYNGMQKPDARPDSIPVGGNFKKWRNEFALTYRLPNGPNLRKPDELVQFLD